MLFYSLIPKSDLFSNSDNFLVKKLWGGREEKEEMQGGELMIQLAHHCNCCSWWHAHDWQIAFQRHSLLHKMCKKYFSGLLWYHTWQISLNCLWRSCVFAASNRAAMNALLRFIFHVCIFKQWFWKLPRTGWISKSNLCRKSHAHRHTCSHGCSWLVSSFQSICNTQPLDTPASSLSFWWL